MWTEPMPNDYSANRDLFSANEDKAWGIGHWRLVISPLRGGPVLVGSGHWSLVFGLNFWSVVGGSGWVSLIPQVLVSVPDPQPSVANLGPWSWLSISSLNAGHQ